VVYKVRRQLHPESGESTQKLWRCFSLSAGEENGQGMASVLQRSQFSTGCHFGAARAELECDGASAIVLYRKSEENSRETMIVAVACKGAHGGQKNSEEGADHTPLWGTIGEVPSALFSRALSR
jgi:hypothetical protein